MQEETAISLKNPRSQKLFVFSCICNVAFININSRNDFILDLPLGAVTVSMAIYHAQREWALPEQGPLEFQGIPAVRSPPPSLFFFCMCSCVHMVTAAPWARKCRKFVMQFIDSNPTISPAIYSPMLDRSFGEQALTASHDSYRTDMRRAWYSLSSSSAHKSLALIIQSLSPTI